MDEKTTTTIVVAISSENLRRDFCLIAWLFRLLNYVEKHKISLKFFRITPYVLMQGDSVFCVIDRKRSPFMVLIEFSFLSTRDQSSFILEKFIRSSLALSETQTPFELVTEVDLLLRFWQLDKASLYYSTDPNEKDYSSSSIFVNAVSYPAWSLTLSLKWKKFFYLHKNDSTLIPGSSGFLELPETLDLSNFFGPSELQCPLTKSLLISLLFNESILDNIFSILVKPKNLRYLNFRDFSYIFVFKHAEFFEDYVI